MRLTDWNWQVWFILSALIFCALFFSAIFGALVKHPNLIYLVVGATANLAVCVLVGCYPKKSK